MRLFIKLLALTLAVSLAGCNRSNRSSESADYATRTSDAVAVADQPQGAGGGGNARAAGETLESQAYVNASVQSPAGADDAARQAETIVLPERKIIRNAELTIEHDAPAEAQRKISSVAESHGGFVVTSESRQQDARGAQPGSVSIEMRVPSARFDAAVAEVRAVGGSVRHEKTTGRDVTEEYIDLEARLRAQRALEAQFLEIMKRAQKVSDALEVQRELANVRGEIERVEGRRRFLENQSALSTIKVTVESPTPLVSAETSGFFGGLREAFGEGLDEAASIVLGLVRVGVALVPVLLLLGVPLALLWRVVRRRLPRRARPVEPTQPTA
jgi:hypothetical protein